MRGELVQLRLLVFGQEVVPVLEVSRVVARSGQEEVGKVRLGLAVLSPGAVQESHEVCLGGSEGEVQHVAIVLPAFVSVVRVGIGKVSRRCRSGVGRTLETRGGQKLLDENLEDLELSRDDGVLLGGCGILLAFSLETRSS